MGDDVWAEIEGALLRLYSLPHNRQTHQEKGSRPEAAIRAKPGEIRSGIAGTPVREEFFGPKLFLRVVGPLNRTYSGEWWFEASLLDGLEGAYSRVYLRSADWNAAIRGMLRELLAVSTEWNAMTEVWSLRLPPGERLVGYSGIGARQRLFGDLPLAAKGNRMLVGRAKQIVFPVKNPFWVQVHRQLAP